MIAEVNDRAEFTDRPHVEDRGTILRRLDTNNDYVAHVPLD